MRLCKGNFKAVAFMIIVNCGMASSNCLKEFSDFCQCKQKIVNCSSLDVALNVILPNLMSNLEVLVLRKSWTETPTTFLQSYYISSFHKLQVFDISENRITTIEPETFSNFPRLRKINLSNNQLRLIETNAFGQNLPALEILNLSNNQILLILPQTFVLMSSLRLLDMRNNTLFYIDDNAFLGLDSLETLLFERCNVTHFPSSALKPLRSLTYFEAKHFPRVSKLHEKSFWYNKLLKRLRIEDFPLLSNNGIHPHTFFGLANLHELFITACRLLSVPVQALQELTALEKLDLSKNLITIVRTHDFSNLVKLKSLNLRQNKLHSIMPKSFSFSNGLQLIDLSENRLKTLGINAFLRKEARNNKRLRKKTHVFLRSNPWSCDCPTSWVFYLFSIDDASKVRCTQAQNFQKYIFPYLSNVRLNCSAAEENFPTISLPTTKQAAVINCSKLDYLYSTKHWSLPQGSSISLNSSCLNDQSILLTISYENRSLGTTVHRCYIAKPRKAEADISQYKTDSSNEIEDISFATPAFLGVLIMTSCIGFLLCIVIAVWGCKLKTDNQKMRAQLQIFHLKAF